MTVRDILGEVGDEVSRATEIHGEFNSPHEGCAVLREEFEELWDCVKRKEFTYQDARKEAIQVARDGSPVYLGHLHPGWR